MKCDGECAAECKAKKMAAKRECFFCPLLFLVLSRLLSPWKIGSSKASNFFKNVWLIYLPVWIVPSLEVARTVPCLKFRRKACAFMWLPKHITLVHGSEMSGINCPFHSRIESWHSGWLPSVRITFAYLWAKRDQEAFHHVFWKIIHP